MTYWEDKRVCVTGGAGMLGAALVTQLIAAGAKVTVLDNFSRGKNRIAGVEYIQADAGDIGNCKVSFANMDAVFNLAAHVAGVLYNNYHHEEMYWHNMRLQSVPVLAAKALAISQFLQVSSVCIYAENKQNPCRENEIGKEPHAANSGYAWAKRMGERVAQWACLEHCVIARPANLYGIHDYFDDRAHVIPALIKKCLHDDIIKVNGTGYEVREFLYVEDAARALMTIMKCGDKDTVYNIGTDGQNSCSISELVYTIKDILGINKEIQFTGGESGDLRRIVNGDRLARLGWKAEVSLMDGLKRVCEWYKAQ